MSQSRAEEFQGRTLFGAAIVGIALLAGAVCASAQEQFSSPDDAIKALQAGADSRDTNAMRGIFGPAAHDLVSSDVVQASRDFELFLQRLRDKVQAAPEGSGRIQLRLGDDGWPFPIPLVERDGHWLFDTEAGRQEILNRRIGRNELNAIRVCRAYVQAQREYASKSRNAEGVIEYAQRLRSSPGTHDGLYWPVEPGQELSPLGPLVAEARVEGYRREQKILAMPQSPYQGYCFKILTRQGKHAAGGKYDYIIHGHMVAGFALVAWPAEWGNSGIMTFTVNDAGMVYQKNLGPRTARLAEEMKAFDPDQTWMLVRE